MYLLLEVSYRWLDSLLCKHWSTWKHTQKHCISQLLAQLVELRASTNHAQTVAVVCNDSSHLFLNKEIHDHSEDLQPFSLISYPGNTTCHISVSCNCSQGFLGGKNLCNMQIFACCQSLLPCHMVSVSWLDYWTRDELFVMYCAALIVLLPHPNSIRCLTGIKFNYTSQKRWFCMTHQT